MKRSSIASVLSLHISDFGTAKFFDHLDFGQGRVGSPAHMAPEIYRGDKGYDPLAADSNFF